MESLRNFAAAGLLGASNGRGRSWPDLDMLPLGWLTDPGIKLFSLYRILVFLFFYFRVYLLHFWTFTGALVGPHRWCSLTRAEQRTQVSLASPCESPSPLMFPVECLERKAAEHTCHISGNQQLFSYCHAYPIDANGRCAHLVYFRCLCGRWRKAR